MTGVQIINEMFKQLKTTNNWELDHGKPVLSDSGLNLLNAIGSYKKAINLDFSIYAAIKTIKKEMVVSRDQNGNVQFSFGFNELVVK